MSLHLRGSASPLEVAKWARHSPAVMFRHYANVIEELRGEPILSVEEQILRAREVWAATRLGFVARSGWLDVGSQLTTLGPERPTDGVKLPVRWELRRDDT